MMREKITSRKNPLFQHVRKLFSSRSYREKAGEYAADGVKLLAEAVKWTPQDLRTVLVTAGVDPGLLPDQVRLVEVPEDIMAQVSPMEAPQGALFTCALPQRQELILKEWRLHGHVHENYSCYDGLGCGLHSSDKFYHWGGLLAYIALDNDSDS